MAYRKLYDGDLVRIVGKGQVYSGKNAIVINAGEFSTRVQLHTWEHLGNACSEVICETVVNKNLLIRNEPHGYIIDGRIDHEKKSAFEVRRVVTYHDDYEEEDECEFDDYDRDDLIDMIVKLRNDVATLSA